MAEKPTYTIATIGLWHLGEIYSVGLAELGHRVLGISDDKNLIANFLRGTPPLAEPQLSELLAKNLKEGRLSFTDDFSEVANCNVVWFTFDTPMDDNDNVDLTPIYQTLEHVSPHLKNGTLIVMTSQVPVGTAKEIMKRLGDSRPKLKFYYAYAPENLRLGEAVKCFFEPGRIVVGADDKEALGMMEEIFSGLRAEILEMSPVSAEMAKHALNAFLATSVGFINDIADICERVGADVLEVGRALRSDPRIGPKAFLDAGLGFSGGTLGRDLKALRAIGKKTGAKLAVIESVIENNQNRKKIVLERLRAASGSLHGKTISLLGLTYKPGTPTLRRSRGLEIALELQSAGANVRLYDPQVAEDEVKKIIDVPFCRDPYEAVSGSEAILLLTPWPEFRDLDIPRLGKSAAAGAIFFDTANFLYNEENIIRDAGLRYYGIGRSVQQENETAK